MGDKTHQLAFVAQRIEHLTTDQKVGGSSPSKRTKARFLLTRTGFFTTQAIWHLEASSGFRPGALVTLNSFEQVGCHLKARLKPQCSSNFESSLWFERLTKCSLGTFSAQRLAR